MRKKLRALGIAGVKVVFSKEQPLKPLEQNDSVCDDNVTTNGNLVDDEGAHKPKGKKQVPASNAFVPDAAGIVVGGEVVKDIIGCGNPV